MSLLRQLRNIEHPVKYAAPAYPAGKALCDRVIQVGYRYSIERLPTGEQHIVLRAVLPVKSVAIGDGAPLAATDDPIIVGVLGALSTFAESPTRTFDKSENAVSSSEILELSPVVY